MVITQDWNSKILACRPGQASSYIADDDSVSIMFLPCGVMWPDVNGKMVRIPVAHTYEQCRKNGKHLGYPDSDAQAWCTQHCDGKICQ